MSELKTEAPATPAATQTFSEYVAVPHPHVSRAIIEKINRKTFPFDKNTFYLHNPVQMGGKEYLRVKETYEERAAGGTMQDAMQLMMMDVPQQEMQDYPELVELAISLVRDMYDVPKTIDLRGMIQPPAPEECAACGPPNPLTPEQVAKMQPHIEKRRILNSIVHGAAVYQWTSAYYIVQEQLDEINPRLLPLYNRLSALVNYWNWNFHMADFPMPPVLQGINKIEIKKKKITAKAMNFPVLIHELSKGVLDYIVSAGIPDDINDDELQYLYKEADKYNHEQWHYIFGPTLWKSMLLSAGVTSSELPKLISKMAKMEYVDLANLCIDIVFHTDTLGAKRMEALKKD